MARSGLSKSQVRETRDRLVAEGRYPSVDAVRHALGDVGSKSTIHRFLKELRDEEPDGGIRREDTAGALQALVEQLTERLHADAEQRLRRMREEHERVLHDKERELAELRGAVARLGARLAFLENQDEPAPARADGWSRAAGGRASLVEGFGKFDGLLSSRSPGRDISPFNMARSFARTDAGELDSLWRAKGPLI